MTFSDRAGLPLTVTSHLSPLTFTPSPLTSHLSPLTLLSARDPLYQRIQSLSQWCHGPEGRDLPRLEGRVCLSHRPLGGGQIHHHEASLRRAASQRRRGAGI